MSSKQSRAATMRTKPCNTNTKPLNGILAIVTLTITVLLVSTNVQAKLYKWVDENGNIQYSDKIPPKVIQKAHSEMSDSGRTVEQTGNAKTDEEIAQEQELERLRKIQEELVAKQKAEDEVLLKTFRSEEDLVLARDAKLNSLDNLIIITKGNIKRFKAQLAVNQSNAAKLEKSGKKVNKKMTEDIETLQRQIKNGYASIVEREQKKEAIFLEYERDIERFRTLKQLNSPKSEQASKDRSQPLKTVYVCEKDSDCDSSWQKAILFVKKHSNTRLQLVGKDLYMTESPDNDDQFSLAVTRIRDNKSGITKIFLDQQCRPTEKGKALCAGEKSLKMKNEFLPEVAVP